MIAIIGAMEQEMNAIISSLANKKDIYILNKTFTTGLINNKEVVVVQSGIGKVSAGITTALLIEHFSIEYVINIGICGGNGEYVNKGETVLIDQIAYHDVDCSISDEYKYGQMQGCPLIFKTNESINNKILNKFKDIKVCSLLSGDCFISNQDYVPSRIAYFKELDNFKPGCFDMEGAAISQVLNNSNIPLVVIKKVSDCINEKDQFSSYLDSKFNSSNILLEILKSLLEI